MHGLLHDLGKLLLLKLTADFRKQGGSLPSQREMESFAAEHHAAPGAEVLKRWQLPSRLQEPVRFHHAPAAAGTFRAYAEVAYVAIRPSHRYGFGCSASAPDDSEELLADPLVAGLGITPGTFGELDRRAPGLFEIARQIVS